MQEVGTSAHRALAVDDESLILEAYRRTFQRLNRSSDDERGPAEVDATLCSHPGAALEAFGEALDAGRPYAVAFLDVNLPGMDGVELGRRIRELDPRCHIVLVTGQADMSLVEVIDRLPPPDKLMYLQKPFHQAEIWLFALALGAKWDSERRLEQHAEQLEALVDERTAELARANAKLQEEIQLQRRQEKLLSEKVYELERFNRLTVGRELRMVELKREVNEMAARAGLDPPYEMIHAVASPGGEDAPGEAPMKAEG